jgi:hypothetical protein
MTSVIITMANCVKRKTDISDSGETGYHLWSEVRLLAETISLVTPSRRDMEPTASYLTGT